MVTLAEAKKAGAYTGDAKPIQCQYCGATLQPIGLLAEFPFIKGSVRWIRSSSSYEQCNCQGAVKRREEDRLAEEARKKAEAERAYRLKLADMIAESRLGRRFRDRTFETFRVTAKNRGAYEMARQYAADFSRHRHEGTGLVFSGGCGTGKTHLAAAICHEVIKQNYQPIFGTMIDLLDRIKATYADGQGSEERIIQRYATCDLLVIDDLGKERPTEWAAEKLYYIANARYGDYLPVVITTNYAVDKLRRRLTIGDNVEAAEAVVSRIYEICAGVLCNWEDYRKTA